MKNHLTGKLLLVFVVALMVSAISGTALADVIWEPENDFYTAHAEDCKYVNTQYYSNGETGYMEIFDKPGGSGLGFADNGQLFYVSFAYASEDGDWGVLDYAKGEERLIPADYSGETYSGWVRLSDTLPKYDSAAFSAEHSSELTAVSGDLSELLNESKIAAWTYPNSGELVQTIDREWIDEDFAEGFSVGYTDEQGMQWAFCSYYRGYRSFWVCLDAPSDEALPALNTPNLDFHKPASDELPEQTGADTTRIIIICVCVVVALSCALITILAQKKKSVK